MDDYLESSSSGAAATAESSSSSNGNDDSEDSSYEALLGDLIFSTRGPKSSIEARWDEGCGEAEFTHFLESKVLSCGGCDSDNANDNDNDNDIDKEEERQAYQDLLEIIATVHKERNERQAVEEQAKRARKDEIAQSIIVRNHQDDDSNNTTASSSSSSSSSSSADVLKAANQIDAAVATASKEALEDEAPLDFMRDAKATVGLGGFNNKGQMRVGGS